MFLQSRSIKNKNLTNYSGYDKLGVGEIYLLYILFIFLGDEIMNKITLMGNLTRDPEMKQAGETELCKFTLAVARRFKKDETDFLNCTAFGQLAQTISTHCAKGQKIAVLGRLQTGSYEKDGQRVYTTDVIVEEFYFCGSKPSQPNPEENPF